MRRTLIGAILVLALIGSSPAFAQTETPSPTPTFTPTPTDTPTPEPWVYMTLVPVTPDAPGQMTRFDYVATAGDVQVSTLLTWLLVSLWGMFLFAVIAFTALWRRR